MSRKIFTAVCSTVVISLLVTACGAGGSGGGGPSATHSHATPTTPALNGFPAPVIPISNPLSDEKIALGRQLFYDIRLSGNGTQSCASCHHQDKAFTDGKPLAIGSTGEIHPRNSQGLANVVYNATLTWANPALTELERQMEVPMFGDNPVEMGINDGNKAEVLNRFKMDLAIVNRFKTAFPKDVDSISFTNIIAAIASFQRTLISNESKWGRAEIRIKNVHNTKSNKI